MTTYAEILQAALTLPPNKRSDLAELLWESMDEEKRFEDSPPEISSAWRAEIAKRSAAYARGELTAIPWQIAREEVLRKYGGNA